MIKTDELSANAKGGTELLKGRLHDFLAEHHPEHLENIDFYFSRVRDFDESRRSVYYVHDLAGDPETSHLKTGSYNFDVQVFVSYWQYQQFLDQGYLGYKHAHNSVVIPNSIDIDYELQPILNSKFKIGLGRKEYPIKLIYHTTPHRGLEILVPVFKSLYDELQEQGIYIELDVYSSFAIYGWEERDLRYQHLFEECKKHPGINYHGSVSNEEVIEALKQSHIFAFPSIWPETSCLALIEAMATGNYCVHSSLGALPETSGGLTHMYPYTKNDGMHVALFEAHLTRVIKQIADKYDLTGLKQAGNFVRYKHSWSKVQKRWTEVLNQVAQP